MAKTNLGLVEYAKAQLGLPYWYGTYGATATEELYLAKKKQYPNYYKATDFKSQYGKRVHDCVGLIKGYLWSDTPTSKPKYNSKQDTNANGMYVYASVKGNISTMPEKAGILVFLKNEKGRIHHVGVYIGNGEVIEARGHAYGVVKTKFKDRGWDYWSECPYIEYVNEDKPEDKPEEKKEEKMMTINFPILKKGSKRSEVKTVQRLLKSLGYKDQNGKALEIDGDFGSKTDYAVRAFQKAKKLEVDGIVGPDTASVLFELD